MDRKHEIALSTQGSCLYGTQKIQEIYQNYIVELLFCSKRVSGTPVLKILVRTLQLTPDLSLGKYKLLKTVCEPLTIVWTQPKIQE